MTVRFRTVFLTVAVIFTCLLFNSTKASANTQPVTFAENNGIFVSTFYNFYDYITGNKPAQPAKSAVLAPQPCTTAAPCDVEGDFSIANNNPNNNFTYGSTLDNSADSAFSPYTLFGSDALGGTGIDGWYAPANGDGFTLPGVFQNTNAVDTLYLGTINQPNTLLNLHPGKGADLDNDSNFDGERTVVRFAAPSAGLYQVKGRFVGIDTGGTTTDVLILRRPAAVGGIDGASTQLFSKNVTGYALGTTPDAGSVQPFDLTLNLLAGEIVEFSVGHGVGITPQTYNNDATGLAATITPVAPEDMYALTNTTPQNLIRFDSGDPGTIDATVGISGLQTGEKLLGIDFRPATGALFALGSTSRLYTINTVTGVATPIGSGPFALPTTLDPNSEIGFDFNPTVDRIRVVTDAGQNFRLNPNTGTLVAEDTALSGSTAGDITGAAYTNNDNDGDAPSAAMPNATGTSAVLFDIDSTSNELYRQGNNSTVASNNGSVNGGALTLIGSLGVSVDEFNGFDISSTLDNSTTPAKATSNRAYAAFSDGINNNLYAVSLEQGNASLIGTIGTAVAGKASAGEYGAVNAGLAGFAVAPPNGAVNFPEVVSINRLTPLNEKTNANTVTFRVTFSESVENFDRTDLRLVSSTGLPTTADNIGTVTGTGAVYDVQIINYTGTGTLGLNLFDNESIVSTVGLRPLSGPGAQNANNNFNFVGQTYNVDNVAPTVVSSNPADATPTNALSVDFTVVFSELVKGVDAADFSLTRTGTLTGGTVSNVAAVSPDSNGLATTYTVTVSGYTGGGTLRLDVNNDDTVSPIVDDFTNVLAADFIGGDTYTINAMPVVSIAETAASVNQNEGDSSTNTRSFEIKLTEASNQEIVVSYSTANGTATTADSDYVAVEATNVTFAAGDVLKTVTVTVNGDTKFETDETFTVTITSTDPDVTVSTTENVATATIKNDDARPTVSIDDVSAVEGNSGTKNFTFTVSLSNASTETVTVDYVTADGSGTGINPATAGSDYTAVATATTLTFLPGETTKTIPITVSGDVNFEKDETFFVNLSSPTNSSFNATTPDNQGIGTITNDDAAPVITIDNQSVTETDSGTVDAVFTVTLTGSTDLETTVDFATANGTTNPATAGSDYDAKTGTLTFVPGTGARTQTITVVVNSDNLTEANETFFVNLTVTNATPSSAQGIGTITNDDFPEVLTINRLTPLTEKTNATSVVFRATFTESVQDVDATDFRIARTGVSGGTISSFVSVSGSVYDITVSGFTGAGTLGLNLFDDGTIDSAGFQLSGPGLQNANNGFNFVGQTYNVDTVAPTVSSSNPASATTTTNALSVDFTVVFSELVKGVDAADFSLTRTGTLTGGTVSNVVAVEPSNGLATTYTVTVSGYTGGGTLRLDVNNDDTVSPIVDDFTNVLAADFNTGNTYTIGAMPMVSINDATVTEGNTGTTDARFTVSLSAASTEPITVQAQTANGTATVADNDYNGTAFVNIAQGKSASQSSTGFGGVATRAVDGNIDGLFGNGSVSHTGKLGDPNNTDTGEAQPYFDVNLGSDQPINSINLWNRTDECCATRLSYVYVFISDAPITETTVEGALANPNIQSIFVNKVGSVANPLFTVPVPSGTTGQYVRVQLDTDGGTFGEITYPVNPGPEADNGGFYLSLAEVEVLSPASGTTPSTITFAPGETTKTLTVTVNGDLKNEADETFTVTLSNPNANATIGDGTGAGLINNDDNGSIQFSSATYSQAETGPTATITVTRLENDTPGAASVLFETSNGSATAGSDYTAVSETVTFAAGDKADKIITIPITDDTLGEGDETINLTLSQVAGAVLGTPATAVLTIPSNDGGLTSISGNIKQYNPPTNTNLGDVTVNLSIGQTATTTTDASGNYTFQNLVGGLNYRVTPSMTGKVFEPARLSFVNLTSANPATNANFVAYDANNIPRILTIGNAFTNPNQAVTIPVNVFSIGNQGATEGNESAFTLILNYDPTRITGTPTAACPSTLQGCTVEEPTVISPGKVLITVTLTNKLSAGTTNRLVNVTFPGTTGTTNTPVTFDESGSSISNDQANPIPARYVGGFVAFSGFESDLAPRNGGDGMVIGGDVVLARQLVGANGSTLNPNFDEFRRLDSSPVDTGGDGCLKAGDVIQARLYSANQSLLTPVFGPMTQRSNTDCAATNFAGNAKSNAKGVIAAPRIVRVLPTRTMGMQVVVPIEIDAEGDEAFIQFSISYDTTQLQLVANAVTLGSGATGGSRFTTPTNTSSANGNGRLGIQVDFNGGTIPAGAKRELVLIRFDVLGRIGSTPVTFGDAPTLRSVANVNGDELPTVFSNGIVTAAGATVGGRVTTSNGKGLVGAIVSMTDANGVIRATRTAIGGRYQFADVPTGATYVVSATSKRFRFEEQAKSITGDTNDVNFTAMP